MTNNTNLAKRIHTEFWEGELKSALSAARTEMESWDEENREENPAFILVHAVDDWALTHLGREFTESERDDILTMVYELVEY